MTIAPSKTAAKTPGAVKPQKPTLSKPDRIINKPTPEKSFPEHLRDLQKSSPRELRNPGYGKPVQPKPVVKK